MITKNMLFFICTIALLSIANAGCTNTNKESNDKQVQDSDQMMPDERSDNTNGNYTYSDESSELEMTISGGRWSGKVVMISGFGREHDEQNMTTYSSGVVKGKDLFDDSGVAKIGSVEDGRVITSISGKAVTLTKQ